jgi:Zn ribbon nucleic-acid-binding protein
MSSKDRFTATLNCPVCGRSGVAHLWQEDGYSYAFGDKSTHIDSVTEGFQHVSRKSSIDDTTDFQCVDHAVSALKK